MPLLRTRFSHREIIRVPSIHPFTDYKLSGFEYIPGVVQPSPLTPEHFLSPKGKSHTCLSHLAPPDLSSSESPGLSMSCIRTVPCDRMVPQCVDAPCFVHPFTSWWASGQFLPSACRE